MYGSEIFLFLIFSFFLAPIFGQGGQYWWNFVNRNKIFNGNSQNIYPIVYPIVYPAVENNLLKRNTRELEYPHGQRTNFGSQSFSNNFNSIPSSRNDWHANDYSNLPSQISTGDSGTDLTSKNPFIRRNSLFHIGSEIKNDDSDLLEQATSSPFYDSAGYPVYDVQPRPTNRPSGFGKWPPDNYDQSQFYQPQQQNWGYNQNLNSNQYQPRVLSNNIDGWQNVGQIQMWKNVVQPTNQYHDINSPVVNGQNIPVSNQPIPIPRPSLRINTGNAIDWYDTKIGRYDTGENARVNRVVLPPDFFTANGIPQLPTPVPPNNVDSRIGVGAGSELLTDGSKNGRTTPKYLTMVPANQEQIVGNPYAATNNGYRIQTSTSPTTTPYHLFPIAVNHDRLKPPNLTKDFDPRPSPLIPDRHQYMFSGGNNQYREDLGRASEVRREFNNINLPYDMIYNPRTREMEISKYYPRAGISQFPYDSRLDSYGVINKPGYYNTSRLILHQGGREYVPNSSNVRGSYPRLTTPTPWENRPVATVIGVPQIEVDEKFLQSRQESGASNDGLSRAPSNPSHQAQMRPYFGPEHITRSNYQQSQQYNIKEGNRNKFVKLDLPNFNGEWRP